MQPHLLPNIISQRDVDRWYGSSHFRRKSSWICIDQPKVIEAFRNRFEIEQVIVATTTTPPPWASHHKIMLAPMKWLTAVTGKPSHPGVLVIIKRPTYRDALLYASKQVVLLDGIQDPGNMGAILRSMVAFGLNIVCVTPDCVDVFHPKSVNASAGALAHIAVFHEVNWREWMRQTRTPLIILDPRGQHSVHSMPPMDRFSLVCGSEGRGVDVRRFVEFENTLVSIPMIGDMESLNVAVSAGIALHYLTKGLS